MHTHIFKRTMTDENIKELKRALQDPLMFIDYPISFAKEVGQYITNDNDDWCSYVTKVFECNDGRIILVEYSYVIGHVGPQDVKVYFYKEDKDAIRKL
jgi:hypothetical protein